MEADLRVGFLHCARLYEVVQACSAAQSCPTLSDSMDCSHSGSSVHGIFQAKILEQAAIFYFRRPSQPMDQTCASWVFCTGRQILYHWAICGGGWWFNCQTVSENAISFLSVSVKNTFYLVIIFRFYKLSQVSIRKSLLIR